MRAAVVARFASVCRACDEPIEPGQNIVADEDGWRHASCDDSAPRPDHRPRCPFCADLKLEDGSCGCSEGDKR